MGFPIEVVGFVPKLNGPTPSAKVLSKQTKKIIKRFSRHLAPAEALIDILNPDIPLDDISIGNSSGTSAASRNFGK